MRVPATGAAVLLPQPILITSACTVDETCDPIGEVSALIESSKEFLLHFADELQAATDMSVCESG